MNTKGELLSALQTPNLVPSGIDPAMVNRAFEHWPDIIEQVFVTQPQADGPQRRRKFSGSDDVHLVHAPTVDDIVACLGPSSIACIEVFDTVGEDVAHRVARAAGEDIFLLSIGSATAIKQLAGRAFAEALARRLGLSEERCHELAIATHESCYNAAIHGNLGLKGVDLYAVDFEDGADPVAELENAIDEYLANPGYPEKRIDMIAWWSLHELFVSVVDQGQGYDASSIDWDTLDPCRGMGLIKAIADEVTVSNNGSKTTMMFRR